MQAAVYYRYGPPDVIQIGDIETPAPKDDEALIKVRAASINPLDWHFVRGRPYFVRMMTGLRQPKITRLGVDVAGHVQAVGKNVTEFRPGDEVFGTCRGSLADYVCTGQSKLVLKPKNVTFEQAAAVPVAALTALQGLRDKGRIERGQAVLINGAAGGVGTFAVQIAKWFGAEVTAVCSTRNLKLVREIGADRVVDYVVEDFTAGGQRYDLVFDLVGNHSLTAFRRVLKPGARYVGAGAEPGADWLKTLRRPIQAALLSMVVSEKFVSLMTKANCQDLAAMRDLIQSGAVRPVIDRVFQLSEVRQAIHYLEQGHARGKVVVALA